LLFVLADNAYDPDVRASVLRIDVETLCPPDNATCLTFSDNGCGLCPDKLHNMLRCLSLCCFVLFYFVFHTWCTIYMVQFNCVV